MTLGRCRRRFLLPILICILLTGIIGLGGCARTSVAGLYVYEDDPSIYIKLESDGKFYMPLLEGTWEVKGKEVILLTPLGAEYFRLEGQKLIGSPTFFRPNNVWVKQ